MALDTVVLEGPADIRDQRWLDERIADIESGVDAVLEIAANWNDGRNVARLHPGVSAAEYVKSKVGPLRLGKADVTVLLAETNWSNRQIAAVAGVPSSNVDYAARRLRESHAVERPAVLGADNRITRPATRTVTATIVDDEPAAPEQWAAPPALMSSDSPEWYTPKRVLDAVAQRSGLSTSTPAPSRRDPYRQRGTTRRPTTA